MPVEAKDNVAPVHFYHLRPYGGWLAIYVGGVVGWISNATGLPWGARSSPSLLSPRMCSLPWSWRWPISGLGGITLPVAGGDGA